jgi:lipoprotein-anchoring transpeptidase ErfK/SrfK
VGSARRGDRGALRLALGATVILALAAGLTTSATILVGNRALATEPATFARMANETSEFSRIASGLALRQAGDRFHVQLQAVGTNPALEATHPCRKVIDVNLTTQQLVASTCGSAYAATPITSGMAGLRTPTGSFSILLKRRNVYFYSPWKPASPYYYSPMFVAYAMEFRQGGFYLHTDPAEPSGAFGAGSQNGPYASHGCVHVPYPVMVALFSWAGKGTQVRIHY